MEKILFLLSLFLATTLGCNTTLYRAPNKNPPDEEKAFFSDVVVYATVISVLDPDPVYGDEVGAYGLILNTTCSYKGPQLGKTIRVVGAGTLPSCPDFSVVPGNEYMFFLSEREDDEFLEMEYTPNYGDKGNLLDDMSVVCGIQLKFPKGQKIQDHDEFCLEELIDGCVPFKPEEPPTKAPTTEGPKPEPEKPEPEPEKPEPEKPEPEYEPEPNPEGNGKVEVEVGNNDKNPKKAEVATGENGGASSVVMSFTISVVTVIIYTVLL